MNRAEIRALVKKLRVRPSDEMVDRTLSDTLDAQQIRNKETAAHRPNVWRLIMESKVTKYSAVATILVVASLIFSNPFGLLGCRSGIVLADVAQKTSEAHTVIHRETRIAYRLGEDKPFRQVEVKKYVAAEIGMVEEQYDPNGALMHRAYFLKDTQKIIIVFPSSKKYVEMPAKGGFYDELAKMMTPNGLIDYITSRKYAKLGRSQFRGREAEGFEASGLDLSSLPDRLKFIFPIKHLTGRLWVDVETSLPVGIEMNLTTDRGLMTGFRKIHGVFTSYDFQWNAELPEGIFDPNIPADYTKIDLGSLTQENAAWLGVGALPLIGFVAYRRRHKGSRSRGGALEASRP